MRTTIILSGSLKQPAKAKRPHNSRMSKDKLEANGFNRLPAWQDALARYLQTDELQKLLHEN